MNDRQRTILILTPGFPKDEADTTCLPLQQSLLRALREEFPEQKIVVLSFQYPYHREDYTWHGIQVISMGGRNKGGFHRLFLWKRIRKRLKELNRENHIIRVVSFWCGEAALVGKRFADSEYISWYCWILGQDAKKDNHYVRRIKPAADELIALSDFVADIFEGNHGLRPVHYLLPGVEEALPNKPLPKKDIDIAGAGSLVPLKQYGIFIKIIAEIKNRIGNIRVVLAGDGPLRKNLQEMIDQWGLSDCITLSGELPHDEVLSLMERSRLFLHTSNYEGFGVACIEALYAGCQVISFTRPMKDAIPNWHIVNSKEEMIYKAISLLQTGNTRKRIVFNDSKNMARQFADILEI